MDAAAALKRADFIDLGASRGNSLLYCQKLFGGRGVGIDVNPRKVEEARAKGLDVVLADARTLELPRGVRFVSACDFLEHLPDLATAREILAGVARAATDFIFIRHPSFEGEEMLRAAQVAEPLKARRPPRRSSRPRSTTRKKIVSSRVRLGG